MASTPYIVTDTFLRAVDLAAVTTVNPTTTTPWGFTTSTQAAALVTQVNAVVALLQGLGYTVIT
jgi:hypothetical protein